MGKEKSARGNASQFYVAGELCRRGYSAVVTLGNTPNTDILCSNIEGTKFVHIQVKTYVPGNSACSVGAKSEKKYGKNFFWVLGGIPEPGQDVEFEYYIIPSSVMAKNIAESHEMWLKTPSKNGKPHNNESAFRKVYLPPRTGRNGWDISRYKNNWEAIEKKLQ